MDADLLMFIEKNVERNIKKITTIPNASKPLGTSIFLAEKIKKNGKTMSE